MFAAMQRLLMTAFILLHCLPAAGGGAVNVEEPMTTLAATNEHLRRWCGVAGSYDACTHFIAYRLQASCAAGDGAWRIRATAKFRPWIFLRNLESLAHEHEHVRDVRRSVEVFLTGLESLQFPTEGDCKAKVLSETAGFGATMRGYALASNLERHPTLRARGGGQAILPVHR